MLFGGVIHQDVELAELFDRERNRISAKLRVADVARQEQAAATQLFDFGLGGFGIFVLV